MRTRTHTTLTSSKMWWEFVSVTEGVDIRKREENNETDRDVLPPWKKRNGEEAVMDRFNIAASFSGDEARR